VTQSGRLKTTQSSFRLATCVTIMSPNGQLAWLACRSKIGELLARVINEKLAGIEGTDRATTEAWAFFDARNWRDSDGA
jgi:hypothetical protein